MYYERTGSGATVQADDTSAIGRVLVIDDDPAFGRFAATALESRGHDVDWAGCLTDGLASLYLQQYDLAIIDLRLPDGTGLELLRQATDAGLLEGSSAIILTGQTFEEPCDIRVFHKPLDADLDPFLDRVGDIIAITRRRRNGNGNGRASARPRAAASDTAATRRRTRVELVLYTSASSDKSQRALRTIRRVLADYDPEQVQFSVRDLAGDPAAGDDDAVVFTPTLVKRGPGSRTYIVGNLEEPRIVVDLLEVSGVRRLRDRG